jgi:predicted nucleotide-binding protein (sugar kinase/HSP70/actin superfamily)
MRLRAHRCVKPTLPPGHPLQGKTVHIPAMAQGAVEAFAAIFRWFGVAAQPTPPSNQRTLELGAKFTSGDECYPAKITVGDFLRILEQPETDPQRTVFFMAAADGPCRFGQYVPFLRKTLAQAGFPEVQVYAPSTQDAYQDIASLGPSFERTAWRALVAADILRKALLQTRPYESVAASADRAFAESVADLCQAIESSCAETSCQMKSLVASMRRARERFRGVRANYDRQRPLIGVVGEIFCRLNNFSNADLVRNLELQGGEGWLTDIAEWIGYCNSEVTRKLRLVGRGISLEMLKNTLSSHIQHSDERALLAPFAEDFAGYEEPRISEVLELARPYLPNTGVEGEMVVSVGKAAYLARHGADGIIDISPFTCMNGIVSEAIYPKLSKDYGGIPIRNFYFDGTQADLQRDLGIYLELARSYREKKPYARRYPARFEQAVAAD